MIESLITFFGRLHPVLLHLPIGVLVALAACEASALVRGQPLDRGTRLVLVVLAALSGLAAGGAGWLLAGEDGYSGSTLTTHRWLGVGLSASMFLAAVAACMGAPRVYAALLLCSLGLMVPAGHFGGTITHGPGFLTNPFNGFNKQTQSRVDPAVESIPAFPANVRAVFENHCFSCHGESRQKGGLSMHTPDGLFAGTEYGPVIVPDDPDQSELVIRLRLPLDDEYHMPPENRPQPTDSEIQVVVDWIRNGARLIESDIP